MSTMMENLEGRQFFSVSLGTAPATPVPLPYPNTVEASGKVHISEIKVIKVTDVASTK